MYLADRLSVAINPDSSNKLDLGTQHKDVYLFEFTKKEFTKEDKNKPFKVYKSMSPVYDYGSVMMKAVLDYMWRNDNSGVFEFDSLTMLGLETKKHVLTVMVSSKVT